MKKVIISGLLLLALTTHAQKKPIIKQAEPIIKKYNLQIADSSGNIICYMDANNKLFVNDSLATIQQLIKEIYLSQMRHSVTQKELDLVNEILRYMSMDGTVTDKKIFMESVNTYTKAMSHK